MANFNKVILIGNVTRNPEVKTLSPSNTRIGKAGLAVNTKYKGKDDTMFIDFVAFGRLAEILGEYVVKGDPIMIEGRLKMDMWEKDGQKNIKHDVVVENLQLLGNRRGNGNFGMPF